ncbi:kinase-like domain-containing protein [Dichomitus squalens]|uniref:Kinase-like domain-containing protein n=1 Tax=Dichomitus squalens TaxID=114155 RepID=A0A4Q9N8S2_9APHY|nr:kinase-like domain-containing protein [Dichomitus squalens]
MAAASQLPPDLKTWRGPSGEERDRKFMEAIWKDLNGFLAESGYTLWEYEYLFLTTAPSRAGVVPNGYMYSNPLRAFTDDPGSITELLVYEYRNALTRAARASDGRDVVIRVLAIGGEGREHVKLLQTFAQGEYSLMSSNHMLPLLGLMDLGDITFGVFPKVACSCLDAYNSFAEASVGDIVDMLAQCLEGLVFLHHFGIAHRDAFKDNFLIQWIPESLRFEYDTPPSRPRVYVNDFEIAIHFTKDVPQEKRVCIGRPSGGSLPGPSGRPMPPEVDSGRPYDPFKLDVWQLGTSFNDFKSTIPEIDAVLTSMVDPDPTTRPTAYQAMKTLLNVVASIPPKDLVFPPELVSDRRRPAAVVGYQ